MSILDRKVYVASFSDFSTLEAEMDDRSDFDIETLASPQFHSISLVMSDEWLAKLHAMAQEEQDYLCEPDDDEDEPQKLEWEPMEHSVPPIGRENWMQWAKLRGEREVLLVIQCVELD